MLLAAVEFDAIDVMLLFAPCAPAPAEELGRITPAIGPAAENVPRSVEFATLLIAEAEGFELIVMLLGLFIMAVELPDPVAFCARISLGIRIPMNKKTSPEATAIVIAVFIILAAFFVTINRIV
jgi:hypothetical protein